MNLSNGYLKRKNRSKRTIQKKKIRLFEWSDITSVWGELKEFGLTKEVDIEKRLDTIELAWTLAKKAGFGFGEWEFEAGIADQSEYFRDLNMGLEAIIEAELLTPEEVIEHGPKLAKIHSVSGEIWRQIAHRQIEFEMYEEAAKSMELAIAHTYSDTKMCETSKEELEIAYANRNLEYAHLLFKLGKEESEISAALKGIKFDNIFDINKSKLADLEKFIERGDEEQD